MKRAVLRPAFTVEINDSGQPWWDHCSTIFTFKTNGGLVHKVYLRKNRIHVNNHVESNKKKQLYTIFLHYDGWTIKWRQNSRQNGSPTSRSHKTGRYWTIRLSSLRGAPTSWNWSYFNVNLFLHWEVTNCLELQMNKKS